MEPYKNICLEMSLKPFRDPGEAFAREVTRNLFLQWGALTRRANAVSVLLWVADGSEILEYNGDMGSPLEWARYLGRANGTSLDEGEANDAKSLHARRYLYRDDPPSFDVGWLQRLVRIIKEEGRRVTGLPVRVGETFDPGPEFAVSSFKYEKHPEICMSENLWKGWFVTCYARLNADPAHYAGFPNGIPQDTSLGTFLGKQSQAFLSDCGFDYLWLSNGFGFGMDTWNANGALFDGERFSDQKRERVLEATLGFWNDFRAECDFPIETRGTNMSTGMDLASDGVPLRSIYRAGFDLLPPVNSPWAALDADFGLELAGWMSHIAEIPGDGFPFRFYTHDPWWINSPWLDRYERYPHDIFLPLSVSRVEESGIVQTPDAVHFLSVDDSFGEMPDCVPNEVIPHVLRCRETAPDHPGPLVWLYPFDEYHDLVERGAENALQTVFFGDWFVRSAINNGVPLNTVVSTRIARTLLADRPELFSASILFIPLLEGVEDLYPLLQSFVERGGSILFYGSSDASSDRFRAFLGVGTAPAISGDLTFASSLDPDTFLQDVPPQRLMHQPLTSGGPIVEMPLPGTNVLVQVSDGEQTHAYATLLQRQDNHGAVGWIRGSNPFELPITERLPRTIGRDRSIDPASFVRPLLSRMGVRSAQSSDRHERLQPILSIHRSANAYIYSGYVPNTTTELSFRMPLGAPVFTSMDARLVDGDARYRFGRAFRAEARVFVESETNGVVSCAEVPSIAVGVKRRLMVRHLRSATIRFLPEAGTEDTVQFGLGAWESQYLTNYSREQTRGVTATTEVVRGVKCLAVRNVTGDLLISW